MFSVKFLSGVAIGSAITYVIGARAGRARYEKIVGLIEDGRPNPVDARATERARVAVRASSSKDTGTGAAPSLDGAKAKVS